MYVEKRGLTARGHFELQVLESNSAAMGKVSQPAGDLAHEPMHAYVPEENVEQEIQQQMGFKSIVKNTEAKEPQSLRIPISEFAIDLPPGQDFVKNGAFREFWDSFE